MTKHVKMKDRIKKIIDKAKQVWQQVKYFAIDIWGFVRSCWVVLFYPISKAAIFYGYNSYNFACRFARRRSDKWPAAWDQKGKLQGMFPLEQKIIICSQLELKYYQKAGMIKEGVNVRKMFKRSSYYRTEYKLKI